MAVISIRPLDQILARYGEDLAKLGNPRQTQKVIARAANYEGRKVFVAVKRQVREQSSIPSAIVQRGMRFIPASVIGNSVEVAIRGTGSHLSLKVFGARQFKLGVRARVWGAFKMHRGAFMGPKPGIIAGRLGGHAFHRESKKRLPISKLFGPSIPVEMVRDESLAVFYAAAPAIVDRVAKEIAAVMRGY